LNFYNGKITNKDMKNPCKQPLSGVYREIGKR